jgi:hypothetical protein
LAADRDGCVVNKGVERGAKLVQELTESRASSLRGKSIGSTWISPFLCGVYADERHIGLVFTPGKELVPNPAELSVVHVGPFKAGTRPMQLHRWLRT